MLTAGRASRVPGDPSAPLLLGELAQQVGECLFYVFWSIGCEYQSVLLEYSYVQCLELNVTLCVCVPFMYTQYAGTHTVSPCVLCVRTYGGGRLTLGTVPMAVV